MVSSNGSSSDGRCRYDVHHRNIGWNVGRRARPRSQAAPQGIQKTEAGNFPTRTKAGPSQSAAAEAKTTLTVTVTTKPITEHTAMKMRDDAGHEAMLEAGNAWQRIVQGQTKLWSDWKVIGSALDKARHEAQALAKSNQPMGRGYNTKMGELLAEYKLADIHETPRAHLLKVMDNLPEVEEWRAKQNNPETLNHPTTVWTKYHRATKGNRPPSKSPLREEIKALKLTLGERDARIQELEEEITQLQQQLNGRPKRAKAKTRKGATP
jgi:hypothetical protein